jgi:hypothetical protein
MVNFIIIFLLSKQTVTNKSHIVKEDAQQEGKKGIAHTSQQIKDKSNA